MSNLFILIKCNKKLLTFITTPICYQAVTNNFLCIGSNIIFNYHIFQYKGPLKNVKLFKKEITNILEIAKKSHSINCYSVLTGNNDYFIKPSEHYYSINPNPLKIVSPNIKFNIKIEKNKNLLNVILDLKKTKFGYYLPILMEKKIKDRPVKVAYDVFIILEENNIVIYGSNKNTLKNTKLWLTRLSKLLEKLNC